MRLGVWKRGGGRLRDDEMITRREEFTQGVFLDDYAKSATYTKVGEGEKDRSPQRA